MPRRRIPTMDSDLFIPGHISGFARNVQVKQFFPPTDPRIPHSWLAACKEVTKLFSMETSRKSHARMLSGISIPPIPHSNSRIYALYAERAFLYTGYTEGNVAPRPSDSLANDPSRAL